MRPWRRMIICKLSNNFCVYAYLKWLGKGWYFWKKEVKWKSRRKRKRKLKILMQMVPFWTSENRRKKKHFLCVNTFSSHAEHFYWFFLTGMQEEDMSQVEKKSTMMMIQRTHLMCFSFARSVHGEENMPNIIPLANTVQTIFFPSFYAAKKKLSARYSVGLSILLLHVNGEPFSFFVKTHSD